MSVAGRFAAEFYRLQDQAGDDPELLGNRLAAAAAYATGAAGVGLSIFVDGLRLPVGASNDEAVLAERLQFTTGDGPCLQVQATGQPVLADSDQLGRRWPDFYRVLIERTSFRAVTAVPVDRADAPPARRPRGCMDVFLQADLDLDDVAGAAGIVASVIGTLLTVSAVNDGPAWWQGPPTLPRRSTITALGMVSAVGHLSTSEALHALRSYACRVGHTIDDTADAVVRRLLPVADVLRDLAAPS